MGRDEREGVQPERPPSPGVSDSSPVPPPVPGIERHGGFPIHRGGERAFVNGEDMLVVPIGPDVHGLEPYAPSRLAGGGGKGKPQR